MIPIDELNTNFILLDLDNEQDETIEMQNLDNELVIWILYYCHGNITKEVRSSEKWFPLRHNSFAKLYVFATRFQDT